MPVPMRICTSSEMRELDRIAEEKYSIDSQILMENAGRAAVQMLFETYPKAGRDSEILVFAGKGNNAGDAFVVARRLLCLDRRVRVFHLVDPSLYDGPTKKNYEILTRLKSRTLFLENKDVLEDFFRSSRGPFTVIDGIFGTGLKGDLQGIYFDVVRLINEQSIAQVVSLDIPSGVNGDTGEIGGTSIQASLTISFGFPKLGHFLPPGAGRRGELINVDISLPPIFRKEGKKFLLMKNPMAHLLKNRDGYAHKNTFGHALLVGGSLGRLGALVMAAKACHKMGTGLVTVATWEEALDSLMIRIPDETMAIPMGIKDLDIREYRDQLGQYTSIVVGPGMGLRESGVTLIKQLLESYGGALVLDADALNLLADGDLFDLLLRRGGPTVLTPHPGEMSRLLGESTEKVLATPLQSVSKLVQKTNAVVVLKGAATIVGSSDEIYYLNHYPNDGMATAGSGDVLAGMIGGFLGQKMDPFTSTQLAIYLHSLAGDLAGQALGHRSMTAPDIIENIGNAFKQLREKPEPSFPEEGRAKLF